MSDVSDEKQFIDLWDGYEVELNTRLLDDFDFTSDLSKARQDQDLSTLATMYMALVGGDKTYQDVREHIEKEKGYFSQDAFINIIERINDKLPKSGNRAQRRSWKNSI